MNVLARIRRNPRSSLSTGVVAVAAVGILLAMIFADGFRATSYDLSSAGVWVSNGSAHRFGRVNARIAEQDGISDPEIVAGEVFQDGLDVFVELEGGLLQRISPAAFGPVGDPIRIGEGASVAVGGGRTAVLDPVGKLFVAPNSDAAVLAAAANASAGSSDDESTPSDEDDPDTGAMLDAGPGAVVAVGRGGDVAVAAPAEQTVYLLRPGEDTPVVTHVDLDDEVQISLAGDRPVVISDGELIRPDGTSVRIPGSDPKLQLPGDDPDHVLVATNDGILSFGIDAAVDAEPVVLSGAAKTPGAARPVHVAGCTYAAWGGSAPAVLYDCGGRSLTLDYPDGTDLGADGRLRWQVNGPYAVLNDLSSGLVLVVSDGQLVKADDWDMDQDVTIGDKPDPGERMPDPNFVPEKNTPPEAVDDLDYGARPGFPAVLPVLDNDKDRDGDVLTITAVSDVPDGLEVQIVRDRTAVQVTPAQGRSPGEKLQFTYTITDGWNEEEVACQRCSARVVVTIADPDKNRPPELKPDREPPHFSVGSTKTTTYPVLDDWIDPDGDPIVLTSATIDPTVATVSARSDGLLTYTDVTRTAGEHAVQIEVSDAPLSGPVPTMAEGRIDVTVEAVNMPPVVRNDHVTTAPDVPVVAWPLLNDFDPDGDELSYVLVPAGAIPPGVQQNSDGSLTVSSSEPGIIQFGYEVSDGHNAPVPGRIRVDVLAPVDESPAAAMDLVVLPAPSPSGMPRSRTVDLLANDVSPTGGVMVVTKVVPKGDPVEELEYQLLDHRRFFVSYKGRLVYPALFEYTVSDGQNSAVGLVVVISSTSESDLEPVAVEDSVSVRIGDVASVPVLANDINPAGGELYLHSAEITRGEGLVFVSGQHVRYLAPTTGGGQTVQVTYTFGDDPQPGVGHDATGRLTVIVRETDSNSAPVPQSVDARVMAGSSVRITIPLSGIDPDGDSVTLLGLGLEPLGDGRLPAPRLGSVEQTSVDTLTYTAFDDVSGTDVFRYRVIDTGGPSGKPLEGEGIIRVGVAPREIMNSPPSPRSDWFTRRPGRAVLDVLANDTDPDGDPIVLVSADGGRGLDVEVEDGRVVADLPDSDEPVRYSFFYTVADEPGGLTASTTATVTVDRNWAGTPPIARDDLAEPVPGSDRVLVDVLRNDENPGGDVAELKVRVLDGSVVDAEVTSDRRLSVAVTDRIQLVAYEIENAQGLVATAIVRVLPTGSTVDLPPSLIDGARVTWKGKDDTEPVIIRVNDVAVDPEGQPLRLDGTNFIAIGGEVVEPIDDKSFGFLPRPYDAQTGEGPRGVGAASVVFVVSDAPEGQIGQRAVLSLPIDVERQVPALPEWTKVSPLRVSVYSGDEPATLDLRDAVKDEDTDPSDLKFDIEPRLDARNPNSRNVQIDLVDGHVLRAVASGTLDPNVELGSVMVQVTDDTGLTAVEPVEFPVSTVPTDRRLALTTFDTEAEAGKPTKVDVLQGAVSTFDGAVGDGVEIDRGSIQVIGQSGGSTGGVAVEGSHHIVFTPDDNESSVGSTTVQFIVIDPVERRIPGAVTFTVSSVPGSPGVPTVRQLSARSVEVAWSAARRNGKEITKYVVTDSEQKRTSCTTALFCEIDGLTPGTTYTFRVFAENERGEGEMSEPSPSIRPDECAAAPMNVALEFDAETNPDGGGQLIASWDRAETAGTPVEGYEVRVNPSSSSPPSGLVVGTSVTLTGLTNGVEHTVTVKAKNQCDGGGLGEPGTSNAAIPAGVPDRPTMVDAKDAADAAGGRIQLTWIPPTAGGPVSDNGDRVTDYRIRAVEGASGFPDTDPLGGQIFKAVDLRKEADGSVTADLSVDRNVDGYRFVVSAINNPGESTPSEPSPMRTARGKPKAPVLKSVKFDPNASTVDGRVTVTFTESNDPGGSRGSYLYNDGSGWKAVPVAVDGGFGGASRSFSVAGLAYGSTYNFSMKAKNDSYESPMSAAVPTSPAGGSSSATAIYGMFDAPWVTCEVVKVTSVSCSWGAGAARGNNVTMTMSGSPLNGQVAQNGSKETDVGYGKRDQVQKMTATDTRGRSLSASSAPWTTRDEPRPVVSVSIGDSADEADGCVHGDGPGTGDTQGCYYVRITMTDFSSGDHTVRCYMSMNSLYPYAYKTVSHRGNGTFQDCSFSSAGRGVWVVVDGTVSGEKSPPDQYTFAVNNHTGVISNLISDWPTK